MSVLNYGSSRAKSKEDSAESKRYDYEGDTIGCEKCSICIDRSNYLLSAQGVFTVCIYS